MRVVVGDAAASPATRGRSSKLRRLADDGDLVRVEDGLFALAPAVAR